MHTSGRAMTHSPADTSHNREPLPYGRGSDQTARYQVPNPLDLVFFAIDRAAQRLQLPGRFIHVCLELGGQVDVAGLKRAVAGLHRVYPVTDSRLEWSPVVGRPRWRLDSEPREADDVVHLHGLAPATEDELLARIDGLVAGQTDLRRRAPLRIHVFRGLDAGDVVVIGWPHALMDGQGGALIAQEIQRLYQEQPEPGTLRSVGDECRDELGALTPDGRRPSMVSLLRRAASHRRQEKTLDAQLPVCPNYRDLGAIRSVVRRLSAGEASRAGEACERLCPGVRFGAFLRACAIRALDRIMPGRKPTGAAYSVPYLMEGRRPPYRWPVCRNLFSLERLRVPTCMALNRSAVGRLLHEETVKMLGAGRGTRYLDTALALSRLPTGVLAELTRRAIVAGPAGWQRGELADTPSLPLGFMRIFPEGMSTFCGAGLGRAAIVRPPFPRTGLAVQVTAEHGRLTLYGLAYECRLGMARRFLDELVGGLLDGEA